MQITFLFCESFFLYLGLELQQLLLVDGVSNSFLYHSCSFESFLVPSYFSSTIKEVRLSLLTFQDFPFP